MSAPEITATSAAAPSTNPRNDRPVTFPAECYVPLRRHFTDVSVARLRLKAVVHRIAIERRSRTDETETGPAFQARCCSQPLVAMRLPLTASQREERPTQCGVGLFSATITEALLMPRFEGKFLQL
jgi:hypothetical protein